MATDPILSRAGDKRKLQAAAIGSSTIEELEAGVSSIADIALPDQPFAEGAQDAIDPNFRHRLISETAYAHYVERGYTDGHDVDDWLQAETEVDHLLLNPQSSEASRRSV